MLVSNFLGDKKTRAEVVVCKSGALEKKMIMGRVLKNEWPIVDLTTRVESFGFGD